MTGSGMPDVMPPLRLIVAYGFLAFPLAFAGLPLYIHMPDYYTRELGLGIGSAGIILMALRLMDAIQDPLIGYISDKSPRLQRLMIICGIFTLIAGMGFLLHGPLYFVAVEYWFAAAVGLTALGLSMVNINMVMIGSLWSDNDILRGRASGMREGFSLAGMLLASVLPAILFISMTKAHAFSLFYIVFVLLLLAGALAFWQFYKALGSGHKIVSRVEMPGKKRLPVNFFKHNRVFLSACFLTHLAASFPAVLFLYFVTDYLEVADKAGLFLFLYFLSGAAFMPVWLRLARKYTAERAWLVSMMVAIGSFIWAFSLDRNDLVPFGVICVLSGAALGADLALPPVMLARRLLRQGGETYATQAYAILNLIPKIALALGTGCAFILLGRAEFQPSQVNTSDALWLLTALYALIPCLIKAGSALLVFHLNDGATHDIQKRSTINGHTDGA